MSFLRGRLGASEAKFFKEDSEVKATKLLKQLKQQQHEEAVPSGAAGDAHQKLRDTATGSGAAAAAAVDVLPEVLRHSLPLSHRDDMRSAATIAVDLRSPSSASASASTSASASSMSAATATSSVAASVLQMPRTSLGRGKYQMDLSDTFNAAPSTANERRQLQHGTPLRPLSSMPVSGASALTPAQRARAEAEAMSKAFRMVAKAFGVATLIVYGGAALAVGLGLHALDIHTVEDIPEKGRQFVKPRVDAIEQWLEPLRFRVQESASEWQLSEEQRRAIGEKYADVLIGPNSAGKRS